MLSYNQFIIEGLLSDEASANVGGSFIGRSDFISSLSSRMCVQLVLAFNKASVLEIL